MPDAKKLPVIYVEVDHDSIAWRGYDSSEYAQAYREPTAGIDTVSFERSVPRCRTCKHFGVGFDMDAGPVQCGLASGPALVPRDGSGYFHEHSANCSDHPEAKR